ncbi:hypothetical protein J2Z21_008016 [Streptomyces griseochromogenes]|uniref:Uncharacterized protein n=1 Tax=Streptomyces griseochromogenes TaxID=68214 RepID=A0ABS4M5Q1_9ACTN|nr:hypothetical protein [Streptomyces griseochromogenes]MBP2055004.1 hypothetical protein [Streptomyces griseochromogenes]
MTVSSPHPFRAVAAPALAVRDECAETGGTRSLIEHEIGRQVLELEWIDEHALRVLMAPPDDWQDGRALVEGHLAVVRRGDWAAVPARSLTGHDLAGPRVSAPRPDGREAARRMLAEVGAGRRHRMPSPGKLSRVSASGC